MQDAATLRDSTQILLSPETIDGLRADLTDRFTLTITEEGPRVRLIGSPSEIKAVSEFLTRNGVPVA